MEHKKSVSWAPVIVAISMALLSVIGLVASVVIIITRVEHDITSGNRNRIRVFLNDDVTDAQRLALENDIRRMSEVKSVVYVSKSDALEQFKEDYSDESQVLNEIEGNPLPAELIIHTVNPRYNNLVISRIESRPEISVDENGQPDIKDGNISD